MIDHVRIVVAGDSGVGKSTLIKTLLSESFEENVPPVLPTIVVPPEVTPERVHVSIIDTPSTPADQSTLDEELRNANVIVLVYDISRFDTLERISTVWLRKIHEMKLNVPIVLAGNKIDLRASDFDGRTLEGLIKPIMEEHRELEVCIECSAKQIFNVAEVFYFAQKSVLHPTAPLYDVTSHTMKPKTVAALTRVFRLCDKDGDGLLNDTELNDFQYKCFDVMLKEDELVGVKTVVKESCPQGISKSQCVTLQGFVFLHTLFIQKGRLETTWTVLRKFGYNEDLELARDYVNLSCLQNKQPDQIAELSAEGLAFLETTFDHADKDKDGFLSPADLDELFIPHPNNPWKDHKINRLVEPSSKGEGYMSRAAFINRWKLFLFDNPENAMLSLVYVGYAGDINKAVTISRNRRRERRLAVGSRRNTFVVSVLGGNNSGKTELVRGLVGLPFGKSSTEKAHTVAAIREVPVEAAFGGGTKTLIMMCVPEDHASEFVSSKGYLEASDVVLLVYDPSVEGSFSDTTRLFEILSTARPSLPVLFVSTKSDLTPVEQKTSTGLTPAEYCIEKGIPEPQPVSMKSGNDGNLYEMLVGVTLNPQVACPNYESDVSVLDAYLVPAIKVIAVVTAIGLVGFGAKKVYDKVKAKH
eukprot:CAMPEP_0184691424 /NCGR_PEP_ID=MMETSP0313-20130426/282_1 /TAXON_ID=2792 /ORGANISM="Porphyridium aerugineum, Strain SAG 1380-2" /LENGTH=641 /DNA_ID=CAMNT_0027149141 /DNA_START=113 /DNA_END=2038 /DNA_ORIENTATION=+